MVNGSEYIEIHNLTEKEGSKFPSAPKTPPKRLTVSVSCPIRIVGGNVQ